MSRASGNQKASPAARRKARRFAVQALYQWQLAGADLSQIEAEFRADNDMSKVDTEYFHTLFHGVAEVKSSLDEIFIPYLKGKAVDELDPVTLAILRMSSFEFKERIDVPYKVVINEAVNLAKKFGAADSHKFVNGVLDKVAPVLRELEVNAKR